MFEIRQAIRDLQLSTCDAGVAAGCCRRPAGRVRAGRRRAGQRQRRGDPWKPADLHWLNTVTFGANQASIERLRKLGRERYLDEQLKAPATDAGELAATIGALSIAQQSGEQGCAACAPSSSASIRSRTMTKSKRRAMR
ncbi:DUF1800 family protein [Cupriavidus basilensis]